MTNLMRILIAYDDSDYARAAIDDLRRAGLPRDVHALVVSVADVALPPPSPEMVVNSAKVASPRVTALLAKVQAQAAEGLKEAQSQATQGCERVQSLFPAWRVEAATPAGTPAWEIIKKAQEWHAELIVVGSQGRSALGRLIMGSVSMKVAHEAHCSVRIGRAGFAIGDESNIVPMRIVIGVDDSPDARAAVAAVAARAWQPGSEARIVSVVNKPAPSAIAGLVPRAAGMIAETRQDDARQKQDMLDEAAMILREANLNVSAEMMNGDAQRVLIEEAVRMQADCIFVGSRGLRGTTERLRLGSVSSGVATNALCSIEIVRTRQSASSDFAY